MGIWEAVGGAVQGLLGSAFGNSGQRGADDQNDMNAALQKEFAQNGIRWKVADAQAAGIHPLYALGANTVSFSPTQVMGNDPRPDLGTMGQDIGRAIDSTRTAPERAETRMEALRTENASLQNDLLRAQIAKLNATQVGPPSPTATSSVFPDSAWSSLVAPRVEVQPLELNATDPGNPAKEAGVVADYTYSRGPSGSMSVVPSKDVKERIEDMNIAEMLWQLRNGLVIPRKDQYPDPRNYPPGQDRQWFRGFGGYDNRSSYGYKNRRYSSPIPERR